MEKTASLQRLLEDAQCEPFDLFEKWPIDEVREACLKKLRRNPYNWINIKVSADRIEAIIRSALAIEDPRWNELFHWYIRFAGEGECPHAEESVRAVEFAISLSREYKEQPLISGDTAKAVCNKLKRDPSLYWAAPSIHEFLSSLLLFVSDAGGKGYDLTEWGFAERAIRRIVAATDTSFLESIERMYEDHRNGKIFLNKHDAKENIFASVQNEALFAKARHLLHEARREQTPDLNAAVGMPIRQLSDSIKGSVAVWVQHQPFVQLKDTAIITVTFSSTYPMADLEALRESLKDVFIELVSDGSILVKYSGADFYHRSFPESPRKKWLPSSGSGWDTIHIGGFAKQIAAKIEVQSSQPGRRRIWLTFYKEARELASTALYVTFSEK